MVKHLFVDKKNKIQIWYLIIKQKKGKLRNLEGYSVGSLF